jgi:hypothetical protein
MAEDVKEKPAFPLGEIVGTRRFTLYEKSGGARQVIVEIGKHPERTWYLASVSHLQARLPKEQALSYRSGAQKHRSPAMSPPLNEHPCRNWASPAISQCLEDPQV